MNEIQLVISITRFNESEGRRVGFGSPAYATVKAWFVKLGLDVVGVVYEIRRNDPILREDDVSKHLGRWAWESMQAASLDEDHEGEQSYETRLDAVWGLLTQHHRELRS